MKLKFNGNEKFPLRHGWLYKAVNFINDGEVLSDSPLHVENAIATLGVGKNMVKSMRYWSDMVGFIDQTDDDVDAISPLGNLIFDRTIGYDPYLEDIGTIWLVHCLLNFNDDQLTSYRHFFNYSNVNTFKPEKYIADIQSDAVRLMGNDAAMSVNTVTNDVMCMLAMYSVKESKVTTDDSFASPLGELKLITDNGDGFYQCNIGDKPSLPLDIFLYALVRFMNHANAASGASTISFADVLNHPMSPGKIFKLDEPSLGRMLDRLVMERPDNDVNWSDSLGLKQIAIDPSLTSDPLQLLHTYFDRSTH